MDPTRSLCSVLRAYNWNSSRVLRTALESWGGSSHKEVAGCLEQSGLRALDMLPEKALPLTSIVNIPSSHLIENISILKTKTYKKFTK